MLTPFKLQDRVLPVKSLLLCLFAITGLAASAAAEADTRWHVVLAAVGNEQNVFDNFVNDFAATLKGRDDIASFTELHASIDERWPASGMQELERSLTALKPQQNEGCLIYLTGHGAPEGIAMSAETPMAFVRPTRMESMLNSCSQRPSLFQRRLHAPRHYPARTYCDDSKRCRSDLVRLFQQQPLYLLRSMFHGRLVSP